MTFQTFLLKYGEIGIKGKNRHLFEDALVRQVRYALKDLDGEFEVHKSQARIYVDCEGAYDSDEVIERLQTVFGLVGICPVVRKPDQGFEQLKKDVVAFMDEMYPDKNITFKVDARRGDKQYPVSSEQINRDMGEAILDAFPEMKVDVHHPDVLLRVEIRQKVNLFSLIYFYFARSIPKQPCAICLSCLLYSEVGLYHKDFSALLRGDRKADRNRCPLP